MIENGSAVYLNTVPRLVTVLRVAIAALVLASSALAGTARERTLWYRSVSVTDGLSQAFVSAIAQDRDGYLWFGTLDGLNRYDGRRFVVYRHDPDDPRSLSAGAVYVLHVDQSGRVWVGTESGLNRYDPVTDSFTRYVHDPNDPDTPADGRVSHIASDRGGHLWFWSSSLHRLDPASGRVRRYAVERTGNSRLTGIEVDRADRLWLATAGHDVLKGDDTGTYRLEAFSMSPDVSTGSLPEPLHRFQFSTEMGAVVALVEDLSGKIWWGHEHGTLTSFDASSGVQVSVLQPRSPGSSPSPGGIRSLTRDSLGGLWVLTRDSNSEGQDQLFRVDTGSQELAEVELRPEAGASKSRNRLEHIFVDRSGVLWIASNAGGLLSVDVAARGFDLYRGDSHLSGPSFVRAVHKDRRGAVWIGTSEGIQRIDPPDTSPASDLERIRLTDPSVQAIHEDSRGRIWVATRLELVRVDPDSEEVTTYTRDPEDSASLGDDCVQVISEDHLGTLWLGTAHRGLDALPTDSTEFIHFRSDPDTPESLPSNTIGALLADSEGHLWVGTTEGLAVAEVVDPSMMRFRSIPLSDPAYRAGNLSSIYESPRESGVLWLGWLGLGFSRFDVDTEALRTWTSRNSALPNDTVYAILGDERGRLWMSTNRGLARFDPITETFEVYGLDRGLQSLEFNARSAFQAPDGELFFGGIAGLNAFHPEQLKDNPYPPQVRIDRVSALERRSADPLVPFVPKYRSGMRGEELVLGPHERDLHFEFAALHYTNPERNRFSYQLTPFDPGWREPVATGEATYTNLEPGRYTFRVRALSSHGVWSEGADEIAFTIRAPFYATPWFRGLGLLFLGLVTTIAYRWRTRLLRKRKAALEREVAERTTELKETLVLLESQARRLEELDAAKSRFFANISHELRTPLTLTLGPLENLKGGRHGTLSDEALADVELALRNTRLQLDLVEQLLALSALEANSIQLEPSPGRLDELLRTVASRFHGHAHSAGLELKLELPVEPVWSAFDEEKVDKIVGNLLSNACKFTPRGGRVILRLRSRPEVVSIEIEDTGIGIPVNHQDHVFERFHRVGSEHSGRPGTGIGLALVRELVELHGGTVRVESIPGSGSTFIVQLPRHAEQAAGGTVSQPSVAEPCDQSTHEDVSHLPPAEGDDVDLGPGRATVLLVEDHADMRAFIRRQLEEEFEVVEADDGRSALAMASERLPDLVISDVMMDGIDGFSLCSAVRADPELEHLPVILLTARADLDSRLEGLGRGADDYLVKPFDRRELLLRVRNTLQSRHRLREKLQSEAGSPLPLPDLPAASAPRDVFLDHLSRVFERRALDESFSVAELAAEVSLSRANLYRRTTEFCQATPSQLILEFRLERAAQLLRQEAGNVSEVGYAVGFKNTSHFVRRFRERFGTTPAHFAAAARSNRT